MVKLHRMSRAASASFALALGAVGLNFMVSLVTARLLGAHGFGVFATSIALLSVLSIPAVIGIDRVVTRTIATHHERDERQQARGIMKSAARLVLLSSLTVAAIAISVVALTADSLAEPIAFLVAIGALPLLAQSRIRQAALLGLGRVIGAQVPEAIVRPTGYLATLGVLVLLGATVSPTISLMVYLAAAAAAFLLGTLLLRRATTHILGRGADEAPASGWWREAMPLTLVSGSGLLIANLPVLVLSVVIGPAEAGLFAVAHRAAIIQTLPLTAVNTVVGPTVARLVVRSDSVSLRHVLTRAARLAFLATLLIGAAMVLLREELLRLFGADFSDAALPLVILTVGQLVNVACGPVGTMFVMSNEGRYAAVGFLIGATATTLLLPVLVPAWGAVGASVATALGIALSNLSLAYLAWSRKHIDPTIVGRVWPARG